MNKYKDIIFLLDDLLKEKRINKGYAKQNIEAIKKIIATLEEEEKKQNGIK